jgi:hypothetical protein
MKQPMYGFFLIEWMVHFLLLTTVALISYSLIASWHRTVIQMNLLCNELLPMYIATDIMRSDIHEAKSIVPNDDEALLSFTRKYCFIRWYYKEKKLVRSTASYDIKEQRWLKPSYGLIAQHIAAAKIHLRNLSDERHAVDVYLQTEHRQSDITLLALLRNGLII